MFEVLQSAILWAQADAAAPAAQPAQPSILTSLPMILVLVLLFVFVVARPQKREQANRLAMIQNLKKNDRVLTSSGIYGVVVNIQPGSDEVTLRVDETNNSRLRVTLSSVAKVLGEESGDK